MFRHEIEIRTDATKAYGWPVIVSSVAIIVAAGRFGSLTTVLAIIPFLVPLIGMTILALDANAHLAMDRTHRELAKIEQRIAVCNSEKPILVTETERIKEWKKFWHRLWFLILTIFPIGLYVAWFLLFDVSFCLDPDFVERSRKCFEVKGEASAIKVTLWFIFLVPLLLFTWNRYRIYETRYTQD